MSYEKRDDVSVHNEEHLCDANSNKQSCNEIVEDTDAREARDAMEDARVAMEKIQPEIVANRSFRTPREALSRSIVISTIGWLALMVICAVVGYSLWNVQGIWSGIIGATIGGLFFLITAVVILMTFRYPPQTMMMILMGSWLVKIVFLMIILKVLRNISYLNYRFIGITILGSLFFVLGVQIWTVMRSKTLTVSPSS